ncbi:ABC transporter ATP-binding protein [Roseivivax sediminis]|uniref:ABC-2 type transport system ATP-binding protein n=1 Tax=Roseivivax sediminis TaxID=936889 RepID=A0A1I1WEN3_9RHOB|nr:ABC transporter ATP-binding protein [Roseivivax sediminis]SFD91863.1 ABC-2 type transport system ATP-binding protein [Roseivivax sediminis]
MPVFSKHRLPRDAGDSRRGAALDPAQSRPLTDLRVAATGVRKTYKSGDREIRALKGIDLHVAKGEFLGVLGPNGAGKTTLIECLEGIRSPDDGDVRILGADAADAREMKAVRGRMGIALQHSTLPPRLTARELLGLQARLYASDVRVDRMIDLVGIGDKADQRIEHLSGGQQQRVAVAMALMGDPELLFLDEPTSQLDPHARLALWEVLYAQRDRREASVIITTHQMEEAQRICDRVVIVDQGRIIAEGRPKDLLRQHFTARRMTFLLPMAATLDLRALNARSAPAGNGLKRITLRTERPSATLVELGQTFGDQLSDLSVEEPTLEELFVKLTGTPLEGEAA